jgi:hypothetical protein
MPKRTGRWSHGGAVRGVYIFPDGGFDVHYAAQDEDDGQLWSQDANFSPEMMEQLLRASGLDVPDDLHGRWIEFFDGPVPGATPLVWWGTVYYVRAVALQADEDAVWLAFRMVRPSGMK